MQSWGEASRFMLQHRMFRWVIIPGIIYTLLFIAGMYFFSQSAESVVSWISDTIGVQRWLEKEESTLLSFMYVMTGTIFWLMVILFYFSLFKYLILIIGSPVFAYLSEKTEAIIEGREYRFNWTVLKKDCVRNSRMALRNCSLQSLYLIALMLLSLIPVVGWVTPVVVLLLECYYFGVSMLDYSIARTGLTPGQSIAFSNRHKGLAIGNGLLFYLMHIVIFLAPAFTIIAATLCVHKIKEDD